MIVAFSGHLPDAPNRDSPRFPAANEPEVGRAIAGALISWKIGPGDHCLCGGARGGDLLFAEACLAIGAAVELLLALPIEEFIGRSVAVPGTNWERRFRAAARRSTVRQLDLNHHDKETRAHPFGEFNAWLIEEAVARAFPDRPRVLVVWDGRPSESGRPGTGDFAQRAIEAGALVCVIDPLDPAGHEVFPCRPSV
jgi:hypothetical protein